MSSVSGLIFNYHKNCIIETYIRFCFDICFVSLCACLYYVSLREFYLIIRDSVFNRNLSEICLCLVIQMLLIGQDGKYNLQTSCVWFLTS